MKWYGTAFKSTTPLQSQFQILLDLVCVLNLYISDNYSFSTAITESITKN